MSILWRLQAKLEKRRQRKRKGGEDSPGTASQPSGSEDLQKKLGELKKKQLQQEDEAVRKVQEAAVVAAASGKAYEGFRKRIKAQTPSKEDASQVEHVTSFDAAL